MAKCDLCGSNCGAQTMVQLRDNYQIAGVVDICGDCEKWVNKLKGDMLSEIAPRMRDAIAVRKGAPIPAPGTPKGWWMRFAAAFKVQRSR